MKAGEYYLQDVREVGSGFRFNADKTFNFFFSYGAIDRESTGTWEQMGDSIILNSPKKPATDFEMTTAKQAGKKEVTIRVKDSNTMILGYIYCRIETTDGRILEANSNQQGIITFEKVPVKSISLLHELWPDRLSQFDIIDPAHNSFEFTIRPSIVNVEFKDLTLYIQDGGLFGAHPLMQGDEFKYVTD